MTGPQAFTSIGVDRDGNELLVRRYDVGLHGVVGGLPDEVLAGYAASAVREVLGQRGRVAVGGIVVRVQVPPEEQRPPRGGAAVVEVEFAAAPVAESPAGGVVATRDEALGLPVTIGRVPA